MHVLLSNKMILHLMCFILCNYVTISSSQTNSSRLQPFKVLRNGADALRETFPILRPGRNRNSSNRREICYDLVGCFEAERKNSPLKKAPQTPQEIDTKFLLYRREHSETPFVISIGDNMKSLEGSNLNVTLPLKIMTHGYKGTAHDQGALIGIAEFLKLMDVNLIFLDWEKGAAGPSYPTAVANTELVGRQLALLIFDLLKVGVQAKDIHVIGFSLGAHVAACASHVLQKKGIKIGRITGLDPASPIYKSNRLLEASRKLDKEDAYFVDVIHTDGSPIWTSGFGLLQPLGHVDFFPNGGMEQRGCHDGPVSLVVSHFEGTTNSSVVCSHVRAWRLFVESLTQREGGCQFIAYPCPSNRFEEGSCFPSCKDGNCGRMGIWSNLAPGRGPLFLVTRDTSPYCGHQLRATILISEKTPRTRGLVLMKLRHGHHHTNFKMYYEFPDVIQGGRVMWGLAAAEYGTIDIKKTPNITAVLSYQSLVFQSSQQGSNNDEIYYPKVPIFIDKIIISDLFGNSWHFCKSETLLEENYSTNGRSFTLLPGLCSVW